MEIFDAIKLEQLEANKEKSDNSNLYIRQYYRENNIAKGGIFVELNLILQQISMGLTLDSLFIEYPQVKKAAQFAKPYLDIPGSKYWDEYLHLDYHNSRLQAKYDLIVYDDKKVTGINWKTQQKISSQELLVYINRLNSTYYRFNLTVKHTQDIETGLLIDRIITSCLCI